MEHSFLWVMQDSYHQPQFLGFRVQGFLLVLAELRWPCLLGLWGEGLAGSRRKQRKGSTPLKGTQCSVGVGFRVQGFRV